MILLNSREDRLKESINLKLVKNITEFKTALNRTRQAWRHGG